MTDDSQLTDTVRRALAVHLAVAVDDITPDTTVGGDLALDSLDVFAVVAETGRVLGKEVNLNYRDPAAIDRLARLDVLTVAQLAGCMVVA